MFTMPQKRTSVHQSAQERGYPKYCRPQPLIS